MSSAIYDFIGFFHFQKGRWLPAPVSLPFFLMREGRLFSFSESITCV